jgi:hypothetical protein
MVEEPKKTERDLVQDLISRSEDHFEYKLTYIGAGALFLSLTLLDKITPLGGSRHLFVIVIGWIFLVESLIINLVSHLIAKILLRKSQREIDDQVAYKIRYANYRKGLIISEGFNWASISTLAIGVCLIIVFVSLNALHPINYKNSKNIGDSTCSKCCTVKK